MQDVLDIDGMLVKIPCGNQSWEIFQKLAKK